MDELAKNLQEEESDGLPEKTTISNLDEVDGGDEDANTPLESHLGSMGDVTFGGALAELGATNIPRSSFI